MYLWVLYDSDQTGIISLNSTNHLILVMQKCYVFFEVGTECLYIISTNFSFKRLHTNCLVTYRWSEFSAACITPAVLVLCWFRMLDNNLLTDSLMSIADSLILSKGGLVVVAERGGVVLALGGEADCCCCNQIKLKSLIFTLVCIISLV
jgi:hypothetical protein